MSIAFKYTTKTKTVKGLGTPGHPSHGHKPQTNKLNYVPNKTYDPKKSGSVIVTKTVNKVIPA